MPRAEVDLRPAVCLQVSLHMRYIQLQRQLTDRMYALEQLCEQEKHFIASE